MSLPSGVLNEPTMPTPHPVVLGRVARVALLVCWAVLPIIVHAALQAPGVAWQYECTELEQGISESQRELRALQAQRARLMSPDRLREQAEKLGLVPISPLESFELGQGQGGGSQ